MIDVDVLYIYGYTYLFTDGNTTLRYYDKKLLDSCQQYCYVGVVGVTYLVSDTCHSRNHRIQEYLFDYLYIT